MLDVDDDPHKALTLAVSLTSRNKVANSVNGGDRTRLNKWLAGTMKIGPSVAPRISNHTANLIRETLGVPVLRWTPEVRAEYQRVKEIFRLATSSDEDEALEGKRKLTLAYRNGADERLLFTWTHDANEGSGETWEATLRRCEQNLIGMHIARGWAEFNENSVLSKAAVELALRRSRVAAKLCRKAIVQIDKALSISGPETTVRLQEMRAQLQVKAAYCRINQLAILSMFRESSEFAGRAGLSVSSDVDVSRQVTKQSASDLNLLLEQYQPGHPDRSIVASNALVVASLLKDPEAYRPWEICIAENRDTADLVKMPGHYNRTLADSSDMKWLIEFNGGTVFNPESWPLKGRKP
ncbi:hypothetical protein [Sinorhizobium meliloti]|uniref:hypothetical protein n=1 Tax=Rhizobium meliloti TaxID=382 RepID=UPI000FD3693D|nr:hypothetical protein [Sinorhizobium meliloti]RVG50659.1 hypothetical protein CN224_28840 [Sinorhizobium meliloti]